MFIGNKELTSDQIVLIKTFASWLTATVLILYFHNAAALISVLRTLTIFSILAVVMFLAVWALKSYSYSMVLRNFKSRLSNIKSLNQFGGSVDYHEALKKPTEQAVKKLVESEQYKAFEQQKMKNGDSFCLCSKATANQIKEDMKELKLLAKQIFGPEPQEDPEEVNENFEVIE